MLTFASTTVSLNVSYDGDDDDHDYVFSVLTFVLGVRIADACKGKLN